MIPGSSTAPRTAVFYSSIRHWGWGAPDYVWPLAAAQLLDRGIPVIAVVRPQVWDHPEVRQLAARGAQIFLQPPLVYRRGRLSELKELWQRFSTSTRPLRRALQSAARPHFFIDQGGAFDFLEETQLRHWIAECHATYDVFFRSTRYESPLPTAARRTAIAFLEGAQRTLFNSQWTREVTETQLVHRFGNAAYFKHLVRFPHDAPLAWPVGSTLRLASVSRLDAHHKGLDVLLQALALLPPDLPAWSLEVYGQGPDESYLRDLTAALHLEDRVRFRSSTDDIRGVWRDAHLLILVSRFEGLSVSMLEAMACGRPVLRTPYGGCAEWILPDETGFVCPAPEPSLIADTLQRALLAHERWPDMGHAAHARIQTHLERHPEAIYLKPFDAAADTAFPASSATTP
jgi:glycosyltransferase involved in cell wall biosynthesis